MKVICLHVTILFKDSEKRLEKIITISKMGSQLIELQLHLQVPSKALDENELVPRKIFQLKKLSQKSLEFSSPFYTYF